jgi:hypothetical protein
MNIITQASEFVNTSPPVLCHILPFLSKMCGAFSWQTGIGNGRTAKQKSNGILKAT